MIIKKIFYSKYFVKKYKKLPQAIQVIALKKIDIFKINPLHPYLKLHELKGRCLGLWSISINLNYRIIFQRELDGNIVLVSIGKHDIYRSL